MICSSVYPNKDDEPSVNQWLFGLSSLTTSLIYQWGNTKMLVWSTAGLTINQTVLNFQLFHHHWMSLSASQD